MRHRGHVGDRANLEADGAERTRGYNPTRGNKVIAFARKVLDQAVPLMGAGHAEALKYTVKDGALDVVLQGGGSVPLKKPEQLTGSGDPAQARRVEVALQ